MIERDLHILQNEFRNVIASVATAEITEKGVRQSAEIIIGLDDRIYVGHTQPIDVFSATIATSQLIERWSQLQQRLAAGTISSVNDMGTIQLIQEKFSGGGLPKEEIMRLTKMLCVANPRFWRK